MSAETKGALWNGSDEPVYDPKVAVAPDWVDDFDRFALAPGLPAVLAPRERVWWVIEEPWEEPRQFPRPVEVLFADVAGRYWRRDCYGGLHEIRQKSFPGEEVFFKFEPRWPDFWPSPAGRWLRLRRRLRQGDLVRSRPSAGRRRP